MLKISRRGADSPGLIEQMAIAGQLSGEWVSPEYAAWAAVKDRPEPPTVAVWLDNFLFKPVFAWIRSIGDNKRGIIWYEYQTVGEMLAKMCGLSLYDPSHDPRESTERIILASLKAHGDGKNLQAFSRQLFLAPPSNGTTVEQAIGRSHRYGQADDTVEVSWFGHTEAMLKSFYDAIEDAKYVEQTTGHQQKILYATTVNVAL